MLKVIHTNKITLKNEQSDFKTQEELELHQAEHPQLYDGINYDFTVEDVTSKVTAAAKTDLRLAKIEIGQKIKAMAVDINESKAYTLEQAVQLMQDPQITIIKEFAGSGSLTYLKGALLQYNGPWYTQEDIATMVAVIDSFLAQG